MLWLILRKKLQIRNESKIIMDTNGIVCCCVLIITLIIYITHWILDEKRIKKQINSLERDPHSGIVRVGNQVEDLFRTMTLKEWLENNPSGFDHHDPQQTVDDFCEWMDDVIEDFEHDFYHFFNWEMHLRASFLWWRIYKICHSVEISIFGHK